MTTAPSSPQEEGTPAALLAEAGAQRRLAAARFSDAIFQRVLGVAAIEKRMAEAHAEWQAHLTGCAACNSGPLCETANKLDDVATAWERRLETSEEASA